MAFTFTDAGTTKAHIEAFKTQKFFDKNLDVKKYKTKWTLSLNLDMAGRPMNITDTPTGFMHKLCSVKKMKFSPMMLIGVTTYRYEINEKIFMQHINTVMESLEKKDLKNVTWYEVVVLAYGLKVANEGEFRNDIVKQIIEIAKVPEEEEDLVSEYIIEVIKGL